ncbi:MAG: RNA 2',3'-cyclic phosphodiesterase [Deltaproteobacteria bacterium]|nr:RNA 2',3'-cyclic phosphodiesterase [Deltaproteobacteria bacterium]
MKTVRCFLALNLDLKTVRELKNVQTEIIKKSREVNLDVNWVPPQNIHITVRFLGAITEPMIQAIKDSLESSTRSLESLHASSKGFGYFKGDDNSAVIYSKIEPLDALDSFHSIVSKKLENAGFKEKSEKYIPHATIGRGKNIDYNQLDALLEEFNNIDMGNSVFRNLVCYKSEISSKGTDYKLLWRLPISGNSNLTSTVNNLNTVNNDVKPDNENVDMGEVSGNNDFIGEGE